MSPSLAKSVFQIRNFLVIALVTVLIWLLAEAESLRVEMVRAELVFRADAESGRYVRVDPDFSGAINVRLEGSTARVDELAERLRRPLNLDLGMEGIPRDPGRHTIDLRSVLRNLPMVRETGASIAVVEPQFIPLTVDNLVTREVKIRVDPPEGELLEGLPEAQPPMVRLRMPEAVAAQLPPDFQLPVQIDIESLRNLPEGIRHTLDNMRPILPEVLRNAEGVRTTPSTVKVFITVRSRTSSAVLPIIPVHLQLAPTEIGLWDITIPDESRVLNDVTATGPADQIEALRTEKIKPVAFIAISYQELEDAAASGAPLQKEIQFSGLPTPLKFELKPAQRSIRVLVKKREAAAPPVVPGAPAPGQPLPNGPR